jgi:hypothetical protein
VTTTRSVYDSVKNVLDYLSDAELTLYSNEVSVQESQDMSRVSWYAYNPAAELLVTRQHDTVEQYMHWIVNGIYSAILFDASVLQISYGISRDTVTSHRLSYVPCPFMIDTTLLDEGMPVADAVSLYDRLSDVALRSPIRFDYDLKAAKERHPAAHLTINSADCRIACVAPMHILRFVDFIFRHFYASLWSAHSDFFTAAAWRHLGNQVLSDDDLMTPHVMWNVHATAAEVMAAQRGALRVQGGN